MKTPTVHTFYRDNIPAELVQAQAQVFAHFDIPLKQWRDNTSSHSAWMEHLLASPMDDETAVIADIDAFPLSRPAFEGMIREAAQRKLVGLSQVANHKDPNRIYAGPMFMAFPAAFYGDFGAPGLDRSETCDVAQILTDKAMEQDIPITLIPPRFAISPKWALADQGIFGVGTFYGEMEFFHLFQSRKRDSVALFCAVADGTIKGRHDYQKYLDIMTPPKKRFKFF